MGVGLHHSGRHLLAPVRLAKRPYSPWLLPILVAGIGSVILAGYFFDPNLPILGPMRHTLLHWVVILAAVALLVGVGNLLRVHWMKTFQRKVGWSYSLVVVLAMVGTLLIVFIYGLESPVTLWIFDNVQIPIEASLLAITAVFLILACARFMQRKPNPFSFLFIACVVVMILGGVNIRYLDSPLLMKGREWLNHIPVTAGLRGILLGMALGSVLTGLRVLMGVDRSYEGER
jgi:hypothetical protein